MSDTNKFYTTEPKYKRVSKEEFAKFLKNYPRKLDRDVCRICDPPSITCNDFKLANRWPYSVVASTFAYDDNPDGYYYKPEEERIYRIIENFEELFASKTGYEEE